MARRRGGLSKEQARRVRQVAANRRIGAKYTYYFELWDMIWPPLAKTVVLAVTAGGLVWAWLHVSHVLLGLSAMFCAFGVAVGWWMYTGSMKAAQRRMAGQHRGAGLGWAVAGFCAVLVFVSWLSLGSQWA